MAQEMGRVAIVGASGGIGRELVAQLGQQGFALHLGGRDLGRLEAMDRPASAGVGQLNASRADEVERFFDEASQQGDLSGAVNLAGSILLKPAHLTTDEDWNETLQANLTTAFYVLRASAKRWMRANRPGSIVLMSSAASALGLGNHEAIAAAKAGIEGLVRAAAATYAPYGIRVNAVAPGLVDTPMASKLLANERSREASVQMHPLRRVGSAAEVARVIAFLLHPSQGWITGQVWRVEGGLATVRSRT